jgi:hypothetical protein
MTLASGAAGVLLFVSRARTVPSAAAARGTEEAMSGLLFVSQAMLDSWAEQGKIEFVGNVMTLLAGDGKGRRYALEPAVRFMKVVGGDADPNALLHKVKSHAQLRELGAEPVDDSCILGDAAYEVQPGFLAEMAALQAAASARPELQLTSTSTAEPSRSRAASLGRDEHDQGSGQPQGSQASGRPVPLGKTPLPKELEERRKEAEALARFLLENLS